MNTTFKLVLACLVVGILQIFFYDFMLTHFALVQATLLFKPWMIVTAIFMHADITHFIFNMISLGLFGSILENAIGKKRFFILFMVAGIVANIFSAPFYNVALGASGAVLGIMGALAVLRPKLVIYVSFIPMRMWFAAIAYAVIDIFGLFVPSGVGNIAHLVGLAVGLGFGFFYRKKYGTKRQRYQPVRISDAAFDQWESTHMKR